MVLAICLRRSMATTGEFDRVSNSCCSPTSDGVLSVSQHSSDRAKHLRRPRLTPTYEPSCLLSPQNMLSTRNPVLLRLMLTNFDALFSISNGALAMLCMGASFRFDERAAALFLVSFPYFVLGCALGDACMSDMEFKLRPSGVGLTGLVYTAGIA